MFIIIRLLNKLLILKYVIHVTIYKWFHEHERDRNFQPQKVVKVGPLHFLSNGGLYVVLPRQVIRGRSTSKKMVISSKKKTCHVTNVP